MSNSDTTMDKQKHHRLAEFIRGNEAAIIRDWTAFARTLSPASDKMSRLALEDHVVNILEFIADDLEAPQTARQQFDKSRGNGPQDGPFSESAAEVHAALRLADGFDIDQMVSEYRALRASVVKLWLKRPQTLGAVDVEDLTRFNEAVDQAVTESVAHYTKTINNSRNLFLGVLGHDLRNPLGAVSMGAQWIERSGSTDTKQAQVVSEIRKAAGRATQILNDLLDLTRSSFGTDIPIVKTEIDVVSLCHDIVGELRALHPDRAFEVTNEGNPMGSCDPARLGQVLSNLMGNAVQYGDVSRPISIHITGIEPDTLAITVHNLGKPISLERQKVIFRSWMRGEDAEAEQGSHLGLGLYIAKLIAEAHGGDITVASDETAGTTFCVRLPRS